MFMLRKMGAEANAIVPLAGRAAWPFGIPPFWGRGGAQMGRRAPLRGAPGRAKWCARCAGAHHGDPKRGVRAEALKACRTSGGNLLAEDVTCHSAAAVDAVGQGFTLTICLTGGSAGRALPYEICCEDDLLQESSVRRGFILTKARKWRIGRASPALRNLLRRRLLTGK